jgi:hypothetical protein
MQGLPYFRELKLVPARFRRKPRAREKQNDGLAAAGGITKGGAPGLAAGQPVLGIDIDEDVVLPAVLLQPGLDGKRFGALIARIADEDPHHAFRRSQENISGT